MRPRREQMSHTLALSGEAPRNFNPPSLPRIFPELRAPLYWSRTDGGCNTLQHVPAETPVTRSAADQESRLRRLGRTDPQDRIGPHSAPSTSEKSWIGTDLEPQPRQYHSPSLLPCNRDTDDRDCGGYCRHCRPCDGRQHLRNRLVKG